MGPQLQYLETVLTCEGNFYAPDFCNHLDHLKKKLQQLIANDTSNLVLKKVEPWNSVRVTFNMPVEAARKLKELAEQRDSILRELGILAIQIEGDRVISLTLESKSNDQAEVSVGLPTQSSATNSNGLDIMGVDQARHDNRRLLGRSDIIQAVTSIAMQGFDVSSSAHLIPLFDGSVKKLPGLVDSVTTPFSRSVDLGSGHTRSPSVSFERNNGAPLPGTNVSSLPQHVAINQLSYELQSFQQQFEQQQQQSLFNSDISNQINNGFIMPACSQTRATTDVPASLGILHPTPSAGSRVWQRVEDRMPITQNIASSSPLLVNLLKSSGGRHPSPNLMIPPRAMPPELCLPGAVMPPQKRKRNQPRTPKRPKLDLEGKVSSELPSSFSTAGVASSSAVGPQLGFLQGACTVEFSEPSASGDAGPHGLAPKNPFSTSSVGCSESQSRHRFMINPYTGDLEEVDDADEGEARLWDIAKPTTEVNRNSWMPAGQSAVASSGSSSSLMHLPHNLGANVYSSSMTKLASMTSAQDSVSGHQGTLEANSQPASSRVPAVPVASALNIPPYMTDASRSSSYAKSAAVSSLSLGLLYSSPSLIASSKPQTMSPLLAYSDTLGLVPPRALDRSSSLLQANLLSSAFQHLSSSHNSLPFSGSHVMSKPAAASNFPSISGGQSAADALPSTIPSHLSDYAISSSFHHFYAMTIPANAGSSVCPVQSQAPDSAFSAIPSSIPLAEAKTTLEVKAVPDSVPCVIADAERKQVQHVPFDTASALVLSQQQLSKPPSIVSSPILSKLPVVTSEGCLSLENTGGITLNQLFSLERLSGMDMAKPGVPDSTVPNTMSTLSLKTPTVSSTPGVGIPDHQTEAARLATEPVSKAICEASLEPLKSEEVAAQKVEASNVHDSRPSITFPFAVLPSSSRQQDVFSLSAALSQNGRIPMVPCPLSEPGKANKMDSVSSARDGEATIADGALGNSIQFVTSEAAKTVDSGSTHASASDETAMYNSGEVEVSLHSSVADLALPPDKVVTTPNDSSSPTVSRTSCVSDFLMPSSFPLAHASSSVDTRTMQINRAAALLQVCLHDSLQSHDHLTSSKLTAIPPGTFAPLGFPRSMESAVHKMTNDVLPINMLGQAILATRPLPVLVTTTTPTTGDRPHFTQPHVVSGAFANVQTSSDLLKAAAKPLGVNPMQPVFHGPLENFHLAQESKFLLPLAGGLKSTVSSMAGTENEHSSATPQTEVVSMQGSLEKLGCFPAGKPAMNLQGHEESEDESSSQKIKFDGAKLTAEAVSFCGDASIQSIRDSNGTSAIGLQEIIAMLTQADERQASKVAPSGPATGQPEQSGTVTGIVVSELKTSEVCEGAAVTDAIRVLPSVPSSFSATAMRFTMFPEAKMMMPRESSHRKSSRSTDDSSPRSKATLTVAKLLEKAESAKMNMQPVSKPTEPMTSLEAGFRQAGGTPSLLPFSESVTVLSVSAGEMSAKLAATSQAATRTNFANISTNCLASKVSLNLSTSLSHGFSMMDRNPLPITAPGYPLNLTESVQKVMQGVGLDTSPPPSPKPPPTSSRLSPAKFSGLPITAVQSRSLVSHGNTASVSTTSEIKSKDLVPQPLSKTSKAASISSIPDSISGDSGPPSGGQLEGPSQKSENGIALRVKSPQIIPDENFPPHEAETEEKSMQSSSVPSRTEEEAPGNGAAGKVLGCDLSMDVSLVCVVDHSYCALPDPNAKKSVCETEENLHDSFEDLPENLNPIDDCHDVEEMSDEITEMRVSHFDDKDLFIDGLIYSEGMETFNLEQDVAGDENTMLGIEVEEPVLGEIHETHSYLAESVKVFEEKEESTVETIVEEEIAEKSAVEETEKDGEKEESEKSLDVRLPDVVSLDPESSNLIVKKSKPKVEPTTEERSETMETEPGTFFSELGITVQPSLGLSAEPEVSSLLTPTVDSCEMTTDVIQPQVEDGTFFVTITSDFDRLENLAKNKETIRRTKPRKGQRNRERRGGRFVPKNARVADGDGKQEFSTGAGSLGPAYASTRGDFVCQISGDMITAELTVADSTDKPCLTTDSPATALQSSGRMTTRSRGRKNPRAAENPVLPPASDSSTVVEGWSTLSPVASKLCENSQRLENPVLLRRSTRTLRKNETVHSGAVKNCDDNAKVPVTSRSRKRPLKDGIRMIGNRAARSGDQSTVVEILEDFEEIIDSFPVLPVSENSQGGKLPSEESLGVKESKEPAAKKSKT